MKNILTTSEVAEILGITSKETIKNWLEGGHFPGSHQLEDGSWRFHRDDVISTKRFIEEIKQKNINHQLSPPDCDDDLEIPII